MGTTLHYLIAAALGYLIGAIPFGYIYLKQFRGIDITKHASGRTGGTNAYRAGGRNMGALTGLSDILKGAVAVWVVRLISAGALGDALPWAIAITATMVVIGHNWSVFIGFGGGAGTTPNIGWAMAVWWPMFPIMLVIVLGLMYFFGMASVASIAIAVTIPVTFLALYLGGLFDGTTAYMIGGVMTGIFVLWSLRPNIQRLLSGGERVVGPASQRKEKS